MKITSIDKPKQGTAIWSGSASIGKRRLIWFYSPCQWLHVQEQDHINPKCWMNIEPPSGAKDAVLRAIRKTRPPSPHPFFRESKLQAGVGK
ncbi:hypothetical protein [Bradyrhizobium sp. 170]|uniref:hypothetical protein n=1 Tax=Bradyrhizobium sp. 170 TaxID=2782641 RepID=UPI001FFF2231|nr:hypothetical protein [Bradyrhizobium sp. 170]UPK04471.1 hypothetical protein IVB05_01590 [Bradyrhizobium sp. 170]